MNSIQQAQQLGQSVWLDYIQRGLIKSGELERLVQLGLTGLTANPTILEKAIMGSNDYDDELTTLGRSNKQAEQIYESLAIKDIRHSADMMRQAYDDTHYADGYPCLEISPLVAYDTEGTMREARRLFSALGRPNVMVKVPATPQGIPAIRRLTAEGINVNVTLLFSLDAYEEVKEAYIAGLEDLVRYRGDPRRVVSVASFFLSRIDTAVDTEVQQRIDRGEEKLKPLLGTTAIASAKLAYQRFKNTFYGERFAALKAKNAHVQRLLWASTGTKNPAYSDLKYVESIIGADTVNTMPLTTIHAFLDHGKVEMTMERDVSEAERSMQGLADVGISLKAINDKLLAAGVKSFDDSFIKLMAGIEQKRNVLAASGARTL